MHLPIILNHSPMKNNLSPKLKTRKLRLFYWIMLSEKQVENAL